MKTNGHTIGRREFLLVSSTCALAATVVSPRLFGEEAVSQPKRLAVGFAGFDETSMVFAAADIPAGDGAFIGRGARVSVSGASGASANPADRRSVELLAHYSYTDGAERKIAPFRAWGCSRITGCQGNRVNFNVPVDETQKLSFRVAVEQGRQPGTPTTRRRAAGSGGGSNGVDVELSLLSDGSLKLVRGFYVLVPLFGSDAEPRWSGFALTQVDGRWALTDRDGNVAPFEHFVLRIDYASQQ